MCENIFINEEAIRQHLSNIGKKVQLATHTIFRTFDATNCDSQRSLFVPSNRINKSMNVRESNSNELCIDIDSSDSDEDSYYVEDRELSVTPPLASIEFCDTTTISNANRTTPYAVVDIEILEENNNDPNNNLGISVVPDETQRAEVAEYESDPLPGCSKDSGKWEFKNYDTKLQEEAIKIHNLLPQFTYKNIVEALRRNQFAENRALLTLWDLLPSKRPTALPQHVLKKTIRNCNRDNAFGHNNYNKNQNNAAVTMQDIIVSPVRHGNEDIEILNDDNWKSYSLNTANPLDSSNFQNTGAIPKRKNYIVSTENSTVPRFQNGIVHPAKLMLNKKISSVKETCEKKYNGNECENKRLLIRKNAFERNSRNLNCNSKWNKYMAYLACMKDVKEKESNIDFRNVNFPIKNSIRQFFLNSKYKNSNVNISQFIKKYNKSNSCTNKQPADEVLKYSRQPFTNSEDLQYSSGNTSISGSTENLDLRFGNGPTVASCKNSKVVSFHSTPKHLSMDTVDATSDTNNIENPIISTQIPLSQIPTESSATSLVTSANDEEFNESSSTADTQYYDTDPNNKNILNNSSMPNSSTSSEQTTGGEKRKDSIQEEIVLPSDMEAIYDNLLSIFPSMEEHYIKELCFKHSGYDDAAENFEFLVDYILQNKGKFPIKSSNKRVCKEQTSLINKHVDNLSSIFPDADIAYLRKIVELREGKENAITEYIHTQCKTPSYITKKENLQRMHIAKNQKQYIHNFNERMFLEIFPDPFEHFENKNRLCKHNDDAFNFLKLKFNNFQETTLKEYYKQYKYNLSLTAQALEKAYTQNQPVTVEHNIPSHYHVDIIQDIPVLQECAFIMHKEQIKDYMNQRKAEELREFEELKRKKELLECECCYDDECMPSKCLTCNDGHIFCKSCIINGVKAKLAKGNADIKCFSNCDEEFSYSTLQKALPPTQFSIFLSKKQETEVMAAKLEGLVSCPFCSFSSVPPPEDKVFRCLNPDCMKESCRLCKKLDHVPFKCGEIEDKITKKSKARLLLEEKMTEALVRKCYKCGKPYFKDTGCNLITCSCGAQMCYICEQHITGSGHFTASHASCPYHSDNYFLNTEAVNAVAKETLKYIKEKDIQIDESILSHNEQTLPITAEISKRVHKVAKFDDQTFV